MESKVLRGNIICITGILLLLACGHKKHAPRQREIVKNVQQLQEVIPGNIAERLSYITDNNGVMEDGVKAFRPSALAFFYGQHDNAAQWSANGVAGTVVDSMYYWIQQAEGMGLLPAHYHAAALGKALEQVKADSMARKDAALWAQVDVMMTDAFMKMVSHLRYGAGPRDSITLRKDSAYSDTALATLLQQAIRNKNIGEVLQRQEPVHEGYRALKEALQAFRDKYAGMTWDTLPQYYTDTAAFRLQLLNRLVQSGHLDTSGGHATDTALLKPGIKAFQKEFNMYPDGVAGKKTIAMLNRSLHDWVVQAGLNMDRWRKLPDSLPKQYVMVNIPGYRMQVVDSGKVVLESRVIVGTPRNRTPVLNSVMTNFVMFPYWRVPYSIVFKEMLPAIKKDINYLAEKNLEVIDRNGVAVDPYSIDWSKLGKNHFPYVLRQIDGLDNSLGIMKFNFRNRYSVYLHDTNNRGLFKNSFRALSHGCVRVQQWDSLAMYLVKDDTLRHTRDSVRWWLETEEKRQVDLTRRIPIYLRYFTAEGRDGQLVFHEDIYGEDKILRKQMDF